jgi:uncharacterized protein YcaQ
MLFAADRLTRGSDSRITARFRWRSPPFNNCEPTQFARPYRFEAYTPSAKRVRGCYAMPLLWGDKIIGWANASVADRNLFVELGFVEKRPTDNTFRRELEAEIPRMRAFLNLKSAARSFAS